MSVGKKGPLRFLRRAALPVSVFILVGLIHFAYHGLFPDTDPAQAQWVSAPSAASPSWWARYVESQDYWLGISYGMSLAFAAAALRRYREQRSCGARNLAIGGVTLSGFLAVAGCFLLGCCGSPMLVVYLNLFGAAFLPFLKPLVAALTAISLLAAWLWMNRRSKRAPAREAPCGCSPDSATGPDCGPEAAPL